MSHPNARLTVFGRRTLVERVESGWTVSAAALAAGVSRQTAGKWIGRYREFGEFGLLDASSRPHRIRPGVPPYGAAVESSRPGCGTSEVPTGSPGSCASHARRSMRCCAEVGLTA